MEIEKVRALAKRHGWREVRFNEESRVVGFEKQDSSGSITGVNVYYSTRTVGTYLDHPVQGKTQLFRRNQTMAGLRRIFEDPRVHTGVGYYTKGDTDSLMHGHVRGQHRRGKSLY